MDEIAKNILDEGLLWRDYEYIIGSEKDARGQEN